MKDAAAIVGIAQSEYAKWGGLTRCTEYQLALETIVKAVEDAGLGVDDLDGFASPGELRIGLPVEVLFEEMSPEVTVPRFRVRRA